MLQDRLPVKFQDVKFKDPKFKHEIFVGTDRSIHTLFHNFLQSIFSIEIIIELFVVCQRFMHSFCSCYIKKF